MFDSRTISVFIDRPFAKAYDFMVEPRNMPSWASIPADSFKHIVDLDFAAELPLGPAIIRFTPRNPYGVLDYTVTLNGSSHSRHVPVRLIANGEGCELFYFMFRRAGMGDEQFISEVEWITAELLVLKSLLEHV